jgi:hypothetical protein
MPEKPSPVTARPRMKVVELGASPDTRMPASKITMLMKNTHFTG